ncbi:hypothetical protein [Actinomadura sp. 9N215]|uniref:hypothetical protein n=1 Tax=Actinomadura sp. 9N215 TaxID=3375150 RepID=UPI0037AD2EB3
MTLGVQLVRETLHIIAGLAVELSEPAYGRPVVSGGFSGGEVSHPQRRGHPFLRQPFAFGADA